MIKTDEDALICDLAETYHIYNYREWPPTQVAIFANGLKANSRIKLKMAGLKVTIDTMLLAAIADDIKLLLWLQTKDGRKGRNMPKSIFSVLSDSEASEQVNVYASGKEFELAKQRILKGG